MNLLQNTAAQKASTQFYVDIDPSELEKFAMTLPAIRRQLEPKVRALVAEDISDEEQLSLFAEVIKQLALCSDFGASHIDFLDTLWTRSRDVVHQRHKSLRHYDANSQSIRLNIETDLLYKEMRADLMDIVKRRRRRLDKVKIVADES